MIFYCIRLHCVRRMLRVQRLPFLTPANSRQEMDLRWEAVSSGCESSKFHRLRLRVGANFRLLFALRFFDRIHRDFQHCDQFLSRSFSIYFLAMLCLTTTMPYVILFEQPPPLIRLSLLVFYAAVMVLFCAIVCILNSSFINAVSLTNFD